ncbi:hypothetical protein L1987_53038 [Smallanthus sonchifolius]|uniref:Uncharacterized protein n=1 Tax=Smallanthus sonchifolius TaxID=185202 RepID=A0ACB9EV52_9ASTR|nr:hypothetical protein L1987_53038 [Smallanthus sonchifolius]
MNLDLNLGSFVHPPQDDQPHNMSYQLPPVWRHIPVFMEAENPLLGLAASGAAASVAADDDERPLELVKANENGDEGSFFDCNICLDLAREVMMKTVTPIYGRGARFSTSTSPDVTVELPNDHIPNLTSAENFLDSYNQNHPDERNQEELSMVDRYLMSDAAGVIQPEIMTAGMRSRRRLEPSTSRVLDVDSRHSRPRRRRLH